MDDNNVVIAIIGVVSAFLTGLFGFLIAGNKAKKDLAVSDRQLLSEDEKAFRTELRLELAVNRKEIAGLRAEVETLRKLNISLEMENKKLQIKIDELRKDMKGRFDK